jgi:cytidylate kinase
MFQKATKTQSRLRLAISGASGSGKTFSSLAIAQHLGQSVALIDTERGSASKYAHLFNFDVCELTSFHPSKYIEAIRAADRSGYDVLIIDSLTHAWFAELELAGGEFRNWAKVKPLERALTNTILASRSHIIATMRSKTEKQERDRDITAQKGGDKPATVQRH